jgi:hypothetical protein
MIVSDKLSKVYRKLVTAESEYQVFQLIERLDTKETKQVLMKMVEVNRIKHSEVNAL